MRAMSSTRGGRGRVGGASGAAGVSYQEGVTAWLAAHLFAEDQAHSLPSLAATVKVTSTASETDQAIDDINVGTSTGLTVFIQAKRAVAQLVDREGSDFTDFITQAVDQHLRLQASGSTSPSRYVLATSPDAATTVRRDLRLVLDDLRDAPRDTDLSSFGATDAKRAALNRTIAIVQRLLRARGADSTPSLVREVLDRTVVWALDTEGADRGTGINLLAA